MTNHKSKKIINAIVSGSIKQIEGLNRCKWAVWIKDGQTYTRNDSGIFGNRLKGRTESEFQQAAQAIPFNIILPHNNR